MSCIAFSESRRAALSKDAHSDQNLDDLTVLKSLADGQKSKETTEEPPKKDDQYVPDESDSTKSRRLAEDYDSTKNGMDNSKYPGTSRCMGENLAFTFGHVGRGPKPCRVQVLDSSRAPGRHFKKEWAEMSGAYDWDWQSQKSKTNQALGEIILCLSHTVCDFKLQTLPAHF